MFVSDVKDWELCIWGEVVCVQRWCRTSLNERLFGSQLWVWMRILFEYSESWYCEIVLLKQLFSILIYFKMLFIPVISKCQTSIYKSLQYVDLLIKKPFLKTFMLLNIFVETFLRFSMIRKYKIIIYLCYLTFKGTYKVNIISNCFWNLLDRFR